MKYDYVTCSDGSVLFEDSWKLFYVLNLFIKTRMLVDPFETFIYILTMCTVFQAEF